MAYSYRISTNAINRIQEAVTYLEQVRTGYAFQFDLELQECIDQLCEFPESGIAIYDNRRRFYLQRFKYHVIYTVHHDRNEIVIHTVVHHSRNSEKWEE